MVITFFKNLFSDLYRQPLRTILTLSGVVWGTFAIVLLLAFGSGVGKQVIKSNHGLGKSIVLIFPGTTTMSYKGFTKGKQVRVTAEDALLIKEQVEGVRRVSPEFRITRRVRFGKEEFSSTVRGVNIEYQFMRSLIPEKGRFINQLDLTNKKRVCFLGDTLAENLFGKEAPVGKNLHIEGVPFTVVGVMKTKIQNSTYSGGRDQYNVFIPYTTFSAIYGIKYINPIIVEPYIPEQSELIVQRVRDFLGNKIGFDPSDKDALFIWDFSDMIRKLNVFVLAFNVFLATIGIFTLMVGGVGVASIMLVVVEERIREIGVKLAVGAKRRHILMQFFFEALSIILIGGLIGFGLAAIVLSVIPVDAIEDFLGVPKINMTVGFATMLTLLVIGTVSGLMPARKAASTDPIIALKK